VKRHDFRDALRLAVLAVGRRFNRKFEDGEVEEYIDDLMWDLSPKLLAQLPPLLADHRRNGLYFPSTGQIRKKILRPVLPLPVARDFVPYAYPDGLIAKLPVEAKSALEAGKKGQGRREHIPEAELQRITDSIKKEARERRREEIQARQNGQTGNGKHLVLLGEGMTQDAFKKLIEREKRKFFEHNHVAKRKV